MRAGPHVTGRAAAILAATAIVAAVASAPAGAATVIGSTFPPPPPPLGSSCGGDTSVLQTGSPGNQYAAPTAGLITSWSFRANSDSPPTGMKLKVARPVGGNDFRVLGQSSPHDPVAGMTNTYDDVQIPVEAGDVIGYYTAGDGVCGDDTAGYSSHYVTGDAPPSGSATTWNPVSVVPPYRINVSAVLEPDCDNDGLADETQDQDLNACPPGPNATITEAPKNKIKTKKKRVTVTFGFSANEQGAGFTCTLDGQQQFRSCVSPFSILVRKGKHTLSVTAIDAGGNAGAAATDSFKVKRKKKKRGN